MQSARPSNERTEAETHIVYETNQTIETTSVRGKELLQNSSGPGFDEPCFPRKTKTTSSGTIRNSPEGIETHREYLFNSALGRLRNREQAEDVVQDTFLAALTSLRRFTGESSKRTWLTGILNHKVCDQLRDASRKRAFFGNLSLDDHCESKASSHSVVGFGLPPRDPRTELESKELREALNAAIEKLPPRQARVYRLYASGFWSGRQICHALQISERNLWIILHRARKNLRESLSHWRSMVVERRRSAPSAI